MEIDLSMDGEDTIEPDVPDPFGAVYANVKDETHMLKPVDNCEFCNAKKFESESDGFYCHSGDIHLSSADAPRGELMRLWTASDADARHFRDHIRYFNGQFSFTSLYYKLDSATTDTRKCPIYTFCAHGAIYHNVKNFGKEEKYEPTHLELYFYDDDPDLDYRPFVKSHEKTKQKDREVIRTLVGIFDSGINPYSDHLRPMGEVENFPDVHIEFNLDQRLDQRVYNKPLTSEVATVWIEGSERRDQFDNVSSSTGWIGHGKAYDRIMGATTPSRTLSSFQKESSGGTIAFPKLV
jgi:hypothetical protein